MAPAKLAPTVTLADGREMPVIGLGTYTPGGQSGAKDEHGVGEVERAVMDALDAGYRHIDAALVYANEDEVGRGVRAKIAEGVVRRQDLFICTKLWNNAHRPDLVEAACRQSLANLGLDYVDLYLMHWPTAFAEGGELVPKGPDGKVLFSDVDILDTYRAMEGLVDKGLVRSLGVSNFNSAQLERVLGACSVRPVVNQVECHPLFSQRKMLALCARHGVRVVAYRPFGGKADALLEDKTIAAVGVRHGKAPGQVILRYLIQIGASPIPKSVTKSRIQQNFDIFDFELTEKDMAIMDGLNQNRRACLLLDAAAHPEYPFAIDF